MCAHIRHNSLYFHVKLNVKYHYLMVLRSNIDNCVKKTWHDSDSKSSQQIVFEWFIYERQLPYIRANLHRRVFFFRMWGFNWDKSFHKRWGKLSDFESYIFTSRFNFALLLRKMFKNCLFFCLGKLKTVMQSGALLLILD